MSEDKSKTLGRCENAVMADPRRWAGHEGPHKYKPDCMHWTPLPSSEGTVKSPDRCPRCGSLEKPFLSLKCASVNENSHPWHHQPSVPLKSSVSTTLGFSEGLPVLPKPVLLKSETVPTSQNCQTCGRENPVWFAANDVWNQIVPEISGFICPICFIERAEKQGFKCTGWQLVPENHNPDVGSEQLVIVLARAVI